MLLSRMDTKRHGIKMGALKCIFSTVAHSDIILIHVFKEGRFSMCHGRTFVSNCNVIFEDSYCIENNNQTIQIAPKVLLYTYFQ